MRSHRLRAAAGNAAGGIITSNLEIYYDFGNTSCYNSSVSSTAVTDLSGNGNNATYQNTHLGSPTFNSSNGGYVSISNANIFLKKDSGTSIYDIGTGSYTIEFFMNLTAINSYHIFDSFVQGFAPGDILESHYFIIQPRASSSLNDYRLRGKGLTGSSSKANQQYTNFNTGASQSAPPFYDIDVNSYYGSSTPTTGWEHFVVSRENTSSNGIKFYRNGSVIRTSTSGINYNENLYVYYGNKEEYMKNQGNYAIMRVYIGKGLTSTEVTQHYDFEKARFGLT